MHVTKRLLHCLVLGVACAGTVGTGVSAAGQEGGSSTTGCAQVSTWSELTGGSLKELSEGLDYELSWTFEIGANHDTLIAIDNRYGTERAQGQIMVVSGRVLASRGVDLKAGYEIDTLDRAILSFRLIRELLQCALPAGPGSINADEDEVVQYSEQMNPIRVGTPSAVGEFSAPWSVEGRVRRLNEETLSYALSFAYFVGPEASNQAKMSLSGTWQQGKNAARFSDAMNLRDWKIHRIGPITRVRGNSTILDFGADPVMDRFATVGDLRAAIAAGAFDRSQ